MDPMVKPCGLGVAWKEKRNTSPLVIAGLVPAIQRSTAQRPLWIPGTSPGMTVASVEGKAQHIPPVIAGFMVPVHELPAIQCPTVQRPLWIPGTSPGMTVASVEGKAQHRSRRLATA